ncbi:MAG: DUF2309 domain-containing protein [Planctomycetota bacterium]
MDTHQAVDAPPIPWMDAKDVRIAGLGRIIEEVAKLLPISGPISAFAFLNTLEALEGLPFDEGMNKGARLYGAHPYLPEDRYREGIARGRIRVEDLSAALREDLESSADASICGLVTRHALRMAMLQYSLEFGPTEELRWHVAEADALAKMRSEVPDAQRIRFIEDTKHWVMRDLRGDGSSLETHPALRDQRSRMTVGELIQRFGESTIESWSESTWEAFALHALWRICRLGVHGVESFVPPVNGPVRHRDLMREVTGEDSDLLVHDVLIRFCAAFTDQGMAHWSLPKRGEGFFRSFVALYRSPFGPDVSWMRGLSDELVRIESSGMGPLESILESLDMLGVDEGEWEEYVSATLLALRGWAGMIRQMEVRPDRVASPVPSNSLVEFLAIRLILDRFAVQFVARQTLDPEISLRRVRDEARSRNAKHHSRSVEQRAYLVFQLAQLLGWCPSQLFRLYKNQWTALVAEIETFPGLERRRIFHAAFERHFRLKALDAISIQTSRPARRVESPRFQAAFCIDAREESYRRHLEEIAPEVETFSAAGFFCVPIYYRGVADAHFAALCPIVVRPKHWVVEEAVYSLEEASRRRAKTRRALGAATHQVHVGSRNMALGALLTAGIGVLASIPLVARVLFPRLTAHVRKAASKFVGPPEVTRLRLERLDPNPGPEGDQIGFSVTEMADISERVLRDIGLTSHFSRLFLFLGHGSSCLNNPHKSAYDCGACTGSAGGPNARALAAMLNDPRIRDILAKRGIAIPKETVFLGGLHNTCDDSVTFYDLDLLPKSHIRDFEAAKATLHATGERNAHERCRRFESAKLDLSFEEALRHVEERSEDLAQTRPEFGNASNALCIVGRRERFRGLFMDRRAFQHSYDPTQDDQESHILARILTPVVPVCEGINMQYFLSYVDSSGWGCGTKLPHNVTSLLGVMDGAASDLRPGLPWQGVEIHEPVRCLFVIETTPEAMFKIMDRVEVVGRIFRNGWAQLAVLDPESSRIRVFRKNRFVDHLPEIKELPQVSTSTDWYRGWRHHLGFAQIQSPVPMG